METGKSARIATQNNFHQEQIFLDFCWYEASASNIFRGYLLTRVLFASLTEFHFRHPFNLIINTGVKSCGFFAPEFEVNGKSKVIAFHERSVFLVTGKVNAFPLHSTE